MSSGGGIKGAIAVAFSMRYLVSSSAVAAHVWRQLCSVLLLLGGHRLNRSWSLGVYWRCSLFEISTPFLAFTETTKVLKFALQSVFDGSCEYHDDIKGVSGAQFGGLRRVDTTIFTLVYADDEQHHQSWM